MRDYRHLHPTTALLVVEVAHTSQAQDRTVRQYLPEYWTLALPEAGLEVYREPVGRSYQRVTHHVAGEQVAPLARSDARIAGRALLP